MMRRISHFTCSFWMPWPPRRRRRIYALNCWISTLRANRAAPVPDSKAIYDGRAGFLTVAPDISSTATALHPGPVPRLSEQVAVRLAHQVLATPQGATDIIA